MTRVLPHGWRDLFRQLLLFGGTYLVYQVVRALVAPNAEDPGYLPFANATKVIDLERASHLFIEPTLQAWAARTRVLMDLADWSYLNAQYLVAGGALLFIYLRRNESFYRLRDVFLAAIALALIGYALFPTAPPRLMPEWGFTDSIREFTGVTVERGASSALLNLYAAVPSMHVCFAILVGWPMAKLTRRWPVRIVWALYPLWIVFVVMATANHYLFDVVLGALTALLSALVVDRWLAWRESVRGQGHLGRQPHLR
jgi:membrane-associated phospholipid phosphatase